MDIILFKHLMNDKSKRDKIFEQFIEKNKTRFENILGIVFADKRYRDIDVNSYFYKNFLPFVLNDLEKQGDNISFDKWVSIVASKKAIQARHKVNQELIQNLINKNDTASSKEAYNLLITEHNDIFWKVILKFFNHSKYNGRHKEICYIITTRFYDYWQNQINNKNEKDNQEAQKKKPINDYKGYIYKCLKNYVNTKKYRQQIDEELSVDHHDILVTNKDKTNHHNQDEEQDDLNPLTIHDKEEKRKDPIAEIYTEIDPIESETDDIVVTDDPLFSLNEDGELKPNDDDKEEDEPQEVQFDSTAISWTSERMNHCLSLISPGYAQILRLVFFEDMTREEIAEELQIPIEQVYNRINRAMVSLTREYIPYNQRKFKQLFNFYGQELKDPNQKILAEDFSSGMSIEQIACFKGMSKSKVSDLLARAFRELQKISKKDPFKFSNEKDEENYN